MDHWTSQLGLLPKIAGVKVPRTRGQTKGQKIDPAKRSGLGPDHGTKAWSIFKQPFFGWMVQEVEVGFKRKRKAREVKKMREHAGSGGVLNCYLIHKFKVKKKKPH